eukprot:CAMPEP_0201477196 /NCGR_PEP_ID=MMETSP0151_2-20130828/2264_1 /ASSEMBLY_ACC=CAM_ASM_000257 /TAXON_ID=200890 /ORGANISM="Paramoeba atlantica, Strain 621/1 / CCAP 1560/9" /LENGTH=147 /DNA_ID=CAMNT_0047857827 /DNA_START=100 /DNA_END=540 /DNA_ORIENTATION=-
MASPKKFFHRKRETAEQYQTPTGEQTIFLATGQETRGNVSVFHSFLPKGSFAPMHYHEVDDELFYIVAGVVEFGVEGEETFLAKSGELVGTNPFVPRRFKAIEDSTIVVINSPSGPSENFLRFISKRSSDAGPLTQKEKDFVVEQFK